METIKYKISGVNRILAVASGKGGVGKSTISVNLALALVSLGFKVGLFDGDIYGPNVPLMLGVRRTEFARGRGGEVTLALSREAEKTRPKIPALEKFGLKVMSIGLLVGEGRPVNPDSNLVGKMALQMVRSVDWGELDFLIIDLPPGTGEPQITLAQNLEIDAVLLVSTPPDVALLDTTKALNLYVAQGIEILGLIENMSYYICPVCKDRREIFPRSEREAERAVKDINIKVLGRIPLNPEIGTAGDNGQPVLITNPQGELAGTFFECGKGVAEIFKNFPTKVTPPGLKSPTQRSNQGATAGTAGESQNPLKSSPKEAKFQSPYLEDLSIRLLTLVRQDLARKGSVLKPDEGGMGEVAGAYRTAWNGLGASLPAILQKELLSFVLSEIFSG